MGRLENKVAIITGAASGMGKATARLFANEGAAVCCADVNESAGRDIVQAIKDDGGQVLFVKCDVTVSADCQNLVDTTVREFGALHILFNNAGIGLFGTVEDLSEEDWDKEININLKGVFLCSKFAVPAIRNSGGGAIINTSSGAGIIGTPASAAYCASKGGVLVMTKSMALDYAREGIRVNAICPGVTDTPFNDAILTASDDPVGTRKAMEEAHPMGRLAKPEEIARAALFLASEESSFTTGVALPVDGGYTAQ